MYSGWREESILGQNSSAGVAVIIERRSSKYLCEYVVRRLLPKKHTLCGIIKIISSENKYK